MADKASINIARDSVSIPPSAIDENGLAFCWVKAESKWVKIWPIDARERIAAGEVSLQGPNDEPSNASPMSSDEREASFAAMSKATLRGYCLDEEVVHSGTDTKTSLIKRLVDAGVTPK